MTPTRFNIRVYGLLIVDGRVLVSDEWFKGEHITKFPGGGLEPGEGTMDCLKREIREEMGAEAMDLRHYYTTDFFQRSAYRAEDQLVSIYYSFRLDDPGSIADGGIAGGNSAGTGQRLRWLPLGQARVEHLDLPIDRVVMGMLLSTFRRRAG